MDIFLETLGPGVHSYLPFRKASNRISELNLENLCKTAILKRVTLRRLPAAEGQLPLPNCLYRFLSELTTLDFEEIECAPFSDAFRSNFFHRALTYRVTCLRDGQEYMVSYGYSPVEESKLKTNHRGWVELRHKNVMCVCATVRDPETENVFYVYDQPSVSLDQMWSVLSEKNQPLPEMFFWRLTADLCEALKCILSRGLHYGHFGLDNIFVVRDRLVLENGLMRKSAKRTFANGEHLREQNVLCDVICILRSLTAGTADEFYSASLRNLMSESSLEIVLQMISASAENVHSFSFVKLIQSLQK